MKQPLESHIFMSQRNSKTCSSLTLQAVINNPLTCHEKIVFGLEHRSKSGTHACFGPQSGFCIRKIGANIQKSGNVTQNSRFLAALLKWVDVVTLSLYQQKVGMETTELRHPIFHRSRLAQFATHSLHSPCHCKCFAQRVPFSISMHIFPERISPASDLGLTSI